MKRTYVTTALTSLAVVTTFVASPAFGYYQDKFNPNSPTYDPSNAGYSSQSRAAGPYVDLRNRSYDFPDSRPATGKPVFIYDPAQLSWAVYNGSGELLRTGPGSSGSDYCRDLGRSCHTPSGTFHIYSKAGPEYRSKIFPLPHGGAPMPYAMFFHGGYAVHGSYSVPSFNASHGCVRVTPSDAAWLNQNVLTYGSTVIVKPYGS